MKTVAVSQDLVLPVERAYAFLAEHENLGPLLGLKVTRLRDGDESRNGAGTVRRLQIAPLPAFEETVTRAVPDERIEYRISKGSPLKDHRGVLVFTPTSTGSRVDWTITFDAAVPGLASVVALGLSRNLRRGLKTLDARA